MDPYKRSKDYQQNENSFGLTNYFKSAHVHGLKYLARGGKFEKLFWCLIIFTSFFTMSYFLYDMSKTIDEYTEETIDMGQPLHEMPFPAITICPETKSQKSIVNVTEAYRNSRSEADLKNYSDNDLSNIEAITQVCDPHLFSQVKIKPQSPTAGEKFIELLKNISIPQGNLILFCKFQNSLVDCSDLFKEVITDDGICYTMNMINAKEMFTKKGQRYVDSEKETMWNLKDGYKDQKEFDVYPKRALPNSAYGLNVVLSLKTSDIDFMCKGPVQGFKVRIHAPNEFPQMTEGFFRIPLNEEVIVGLRSQIIKDETRFDGTCHTHESKTLKYFKEYSQLNCLDECRSNFVHKKCGCVKFHMHYDNKTKVCNQHDIQCVVDAVDEFYIKERFKTNFPCDCKPSCNYIKYDTDVSSAVFDFKRVFEAYDKSMDEEFPETLMSRLSIYFKDDHFTLRTLTDAKQSWSEIAAQFGGIIAIFLGASLISIVELIYCFLRHIFC